MDVIDINSSIFGYDMAQLQLPDTNIVFRDPEHNGTGTFNLIGLTGVNEMKLNLDRPSKNKLEPNDIYYYVVNTFL